MSGENLSILLNMVFIRRQELPQYLPTANIYFLEKKDDIYWVSTKIIEDLKTGAL